MEFDNWEQLKGILYLGAVATALTAIYKVYAWLLPKVRFIYGKLKWAMSDENDHQIIMERLDAIAGKLERNGGSHIPDSLDRIEKHVKFLSARQQASLHMNPNPIFETDEIGEVNFVNHAYRKAFGIDGAEAERMGWVNIIPAKDRDDVVSKWFMAVNDKRTFNEYVDLLGHNGKTRPCHVVAYVIRHDDSDAVLGHHGEVTFMDQAV